MKLGKLWRVFGWACLAAMACSAWDCAGRWQTQGQWAAVFLKLWVYWFSWLAAPVLWVALCVKAAQAVRRQVWGAAGMHMLAVALVSVGLWATLIEPHQIHIRYTTLTGMPAAAGAQPLRLALVADVHWGLFFRDHQVRHLAERLNELDADAVIVAGDWTYEPKRDLEAGFAPFKSLRMPVFGVLGNHDLQWPGPALQAELRQALSQNGVQLIEGRRVAWKGWELVGLDDLGGGKPLPQIRRLWPVRHPWMPQLYPHPPVGKADAVPPVVPPRLVVVHQPDTVSLMPPEAAFLSMAGHTHGGQIWLPGITERVLAAQNRHGWWNGLYATRAGALFVTQGVGTIGLPARWLRPPTIDVISIQP